MKSLRDKNNLKLLLKVNSISRSFLISILFYYPMNSSGFRYRNSAWAVDYAVHYVGQKKRTAYVKDRVLFYKHCRKNYAHHKDKGYHLNHLIFAQLSVVHHGKVDAERIVHMDTRKKVCRSIGRVQIFAESGAEIMVGKIRGTQIVPVRIDGRDQKKERHSGK
jgi:hypothetical protein